MARRWRVLTPALVVLLLIPVPFNIGDFDGDAFGPRYMEEREEVFTTAVRMPFAGRVPPDVQPLPDAYSSEITIGFLLGAERNGHLSPSTGPIDARTRNEYLVRLGVASRPLEGVPQGRCRQVRRRLELSPRKGQVYAIDGPVRIATEADGRPTGPFVVFEGNDLTNELTIELDGLHLLMSGARGRQGFRLCGPS